MISYQMKDLRRVQVYFTRADFKLIPNASAVLGAIIILLDERVGLFGKHSIYSTFSILVINELEF